jgi:t-SNARE complex subunit (syntaxin)
MNYARQTLLRGVNAARRVLGEEDSSQEIQLKHIRCELGELRQEVSQIGQQQAIKLDRIESNVSENRLALSQLMKQVDKALQPRWRGVIGLTAACVITTIIIMILLT